MDTTRLTLRKLLQELTAIEDALVDLSRSMAQGDPRTDDVNAAHGAVLEAELRIALAIEDKAE